MPLLQTKLHIPSTRPELVRRPRLLERLNEGLHRKLTLISAPAGFGKTTLVIEWLNGAGLPLTWLSLDKDDNDPVRFLTYLVAALRGIDAGIGQATQGLLGAPQVPAVDLAMTSLINGIAAVSQPFALVLDDYQHICTEWIHKAVEFLIVHQPSQMHVVLVTRTDPPLPLPRLRVRGQVTEIRAEDLRFATAETVAFLSQTLGVTLGAEVIDALESRTEGWIAGLQLASLALQGLPSMQEEATDAIAGFVAAFRGSHRHVIDYLADEVLAQQPGEIRRFLCQTAILDRLTAPLCDEVTGREDSQDLLRQLEQANLFLAPLDDRRQWFRYHALFADFLRTELDPETRTALHLKAAHWFAAQDLLPEAVKHALASGDVDYAAEVIALAAEEAFRTASIATLSGWLEALPDESVRARAELATYKGLVLFLSDRRDEAATYADAIDPVSLSEAPPSSRGRVYTLQAHVALCNNTPDTVVQLARRALDCLDDGDAVFRDLTLNVLGQALEFEGDVASAADVYRDAFMLRRKTRNQLGTMVVLTNLAFSLNELGRRREAVELCKQVVEERMPQPGRGFSLTEGAYLPWSLLSLEANELSLAHKQAARALPLCQQARVADGVRWAHFVLARVHLANGEVDEMSEVCREEGRLATQASRSMHAAWFAALEAQASLQQGDLAAAARWAEEAHLSPSDVPHRWSEFSYFVYVRLLVAQARLVEAQALLATMERYAVQGERQRSLITVYLLQALAFLALDDDPQALARVEAALRLSAPQDYRRAFLDEGPAILALLPGVRHVAPAFVDSLQPSGERSIRPPQGVLVEPLTDREAEILRLIAAGRSNPDIADSLYLSLNTVKWHAKNLYGKLGVSSRVEAITRAQELDLL